MSDERFPTTPAGLKKMQEELKHLQSVERPKISGEIDLVINTTFGKKEIADSFSIRRESLMHSVPYYTTVQAARMAVGAIEALARGRIPVTALQDALGLRTVGK